MRRRGSEVAGSRSDVKHGQPAGSLAPHLELPDLPEHLAGDVLDHEPVAVELGLDDGAVKARRPEISGREQRAVDLDLPQGIVEEARLGAQRRRDRVRPGRGS